MGKSNRAVELTKQIVRMNTINPPGNETACAQTLGALLEKEGFVVEYHELAPNRANLIARIGGAENKLPLCFTGHLDTVPLGIARWEKPPFDGETDKGKLFGRGTSDMKSGIAAFVTAIAGLGKKLDRSPGLELVFTAGEETGCQGAFGLVATPGLLGRVGAVLVGEPTSNYPMLGHKGAYWINAKTHGVTAHGSMPEKGVNAAYKAAKVLVALEKFKFKNDPHHLMGQASLNVGTINGGLNINSVPDETAIGIDIRSVPSSPHDKIKEALQNAIDSDVTLETILDVGPVFTEPSDPWVQEVYSIMSPLIGENPDSKTATYFTDAAALNEAYSHPPTIIMGPGKPELAHQTDEYCELGSIETAVAAYEDIVCQWCML